MSKYLTKKGHKGGLERERLIAPNQGRQGPMPNMGMNSTMHESHANTKAQGVTQPQGKPHSKVVANTPTKPGQHL